MNDKNRPFFVSVKERKSLCSGGSPKNTQHIVLDLHDHNITYEVGDCIGIYPHHDPDLIDLTLKALDATGEECILNKKSGEECLLKDFLNHKANISNINRKLVMAFAEKQTDETKKLFLLSLLEKENRQKLKEFVERPLWAFLSENSEVSLSPEEICDMLQPLLPRYYSIASSQMVHKKEVHLTVAMLEYSQEGYEKKGVCTHYLCNLADVKVPVFVHKHRGFTLPKEGDTPIIMIGPGTGIAPFRGFMQERIATGAQGANWLFFGDWTKEKEFYYGDFWRRLEKEGKLRLDLAFSRDQDHKIYVQHRMKENAKDLYQWIQAGAVIYVCGDMHRMAKDVDRALHEIIAEQGRLSEQEAKEIIQQLRKNRRYLRDVY